MDEEILYRTIQKDEMGQEYILISIEGKNYKVILTSSQQ